MMYPQEPQMVEAIRDFVYKHGYSPSVRELAASIGVASTSTAHLILRSLREKGTVTWKDGQDRTIRLADEVRFR